MKHWKRPAAGILLSVVSLITVLGMSLALTNHTPNAHASTHSGPSASYSGKAGSITRIATSLTIPKKAASVAGKHVKVVPFMHVPHQKLTRGTPPAIQLAATKAAASLAEGTVKHNFDGISDQSQAVANGGPDFALTPPDQGLCTGFDPNVPKKTVVFELVNSALQETSTDGAALPGTPLLGNQIVPFGAFWEVGAFSDPRCFYDASTKTFFFTVIGTLQTGPAAGNTSIDIAVYNKNGFASYQIDSSVGGQFFGDQPHVGYDNNNLYASTDAFNPAGNVYFGATLFVASKAQLVSESATVNEASFPPVSLGGIPVLTLEPAIGTTSTNTEYLMNSFPFTDADITNNPTSHLLGLWNVANGDQLTKGHPEKLTLNGTLIQSETYGFTVPALSNGTGAVDNNGITSETALQPDDDRLLQVQFINGRLWTALTTAIAIGTDPVTRDGVAWFKVDPKAQVVTDQGYIAEAGTYLIYPAIYHALGGTTAITFTTTSPTLSPSAAYVLRKEDNEHFSNVQLAAQGTAPHLSFADAQIGSGRWGDYSAATLDPNGNDIWLATEYVPPTADWNVFDNWGTRVFDVVGNS